MNRQGIKCSRCILLLLPLKRDAASKMRTGRMPDFLIIDHLARAL